METSARCGREGEPLEAAFGNLVLREQCGGPGGHRSARGAGHPHVCFLLEGSFTERRASKAVTRTRGGVRLSPEGDAHDVEFGPAGARCLMISVPERLRPADGPRFTRSPSLDELCRSIHDEILHPDPCTPLVVEAAAYECFDALRPDPETEDAPGAWLPRVRDFLHDRADRIPTLDEVAAVADRHPTHLARAFREGYGCTVGHYARRIRLRRTVELIRDASRSLADVAYAMGFTDQSHMTRAVRDALGRTPGQIRRAGGR